MATNKAIITAAQLKAARACNEQVQLFRKLFGDSVNVTVARARKVADQFDWNFAKRFLDEEGRSEYKRVNGAALSEYKRVSGAALSEYKCVNGAAWFEYDRLSAAAWSECERVSGAALSEYKRVRAAAWASAYIATSKRKGAA